MSLTERLRLAAAAATGVAAILLRAKTPTAKRDITQPAGADLDPIERASNGGARLLQVVAGLQVEPEFGLDSKIPS